MGWGSSHAVSVAVSGGRWGLTAPPVPRPPGSVDWPFQRPRGGGGGEGRPAPCFSPIGDSTFCNWGFCLFVKKEMHPPPATGAGGRFNSGKLSCEELFFFSPKVGQPLPPRHTDSVAQRTVRTATVNGRPALGPGGGERQRFNVQMYKKDKKKKKKLKFFRSGGETSSTLTAPHQVTR